MTRPKGDSLVPTVSIMEARVPYWARSAIRDKGWVLFQPDCLLAVRVHYRMTPTPLPDDWGLVTFRVDGVVAEAPIIPDAVPWFAVEIAAGWHTFTIEPDVHSDMVKPVRLEVRRGSVILVDVYAGTQWWPRWLGGRPPSVGFRVLPLGLAHNGRWGERWNHRLGWSG